MSHTAKIVVLSAITLLGLSTVVPAPSSASPVAAQSRMQQMMDRSARRQARVNQERRLAEEEARLAAEAEAEAAAEAEAEAARQAQARAAAQTTVVPSTADAAEEPSDEGEDQAETPTPQI